MSQPRSTTDGPEVGNWFGPLSGFVLAGSIGVVMTQLGPLVLFAAVDCDANRCSRPTIEIAYLLATWIPAATVLVLGPVAAIAARKRGRTRLALVALVVQACAFGTAVALSQ